jgi:protein-tyrosine phosphatase
MGRSEEADDLYPQSMTWPHGRSRHGGADEIPIPGPGRLWLCGKHFIGPDAEAALAEVGADTAVCLVQAYELEGRYPRYLKWLAAHGDTRAVWFPIPDLGVPSVNAATELLGDLGARLDAGETLLVHCGAGLGRAGTVAAGLLMARGATAAEAIAVVGSCRPMAGPQSELQRMLLEELEARRADLRG